MLGNGKKGGIAAMIIGEMKKKSGGGDSGGGDWGKGKPGMTMSEDDSEDGGEEEATMGEFISAVKSGDNAAALEAFKALAEAC